MAIDPHKAEEQRRAARARWPIARFRLGQEPPDDLSEVTTPAERIAMMRELAEAAWRAAGPGRPTIAGTSPPASLGRARRLPTTMILEGLNDDFRDLLVLLVDGGVEFVIVGAYALAFHGAPRASGDIDLFVRPSLPNAQRVFGALARFGVPLESAGVRAADFAQPGVVYQVGLPLGASTS